MVRLLKLRFSIVRKTFLVLSITILMLCFSSCKKGNSIRVQNKMIFPIDDLQIGNTKFELVDMRKTTNYKPISVGDFSISGSVTMIGNLTGGGNIPAGDHKYTLVFDESGKSIKLVKDL